LFSYGRLTVILLALLVLSLIVSPIYAQQSTQRLKLNICAYAKDSVGTFNVWASYKGETKQKNVSFYGPKNCSYAGYSGKWVSLIFGPKERGLLDFYKVCITNFSTDEENCQRNHWFPTYSSDTRRMEIFSNR
jgi:hypothetical protein